MTAEQLSLPVETNQLAPAGRYRAQAEMYLRASLSLACEGWYPYATWDGLDSVQGEIPKLRYITDPAELKAEITHMKREMQATAQHLTPEQITQLLTQAQQEVIMSSTDEDFIRLAEAIPLPVSVTHSLVTAA